MKKLQDVSAFVFITCVTILATVSILGVWKIFGEDVISKSIQTISLLATVTIIITIAGKFFDSSTQLTATNSATVLEINPAFSSIRHITLATLIISVAILALLGVLAIWDVLSGDTLSKSLSSMAIIAFSSIIIIMTCLHREKHKLMQAQISGWSILLMIVIGWILLRFLLGL